MRIITVAVTMMMMMVTAVVRMEMMMEETMAIFSQMVKLDQGTRKTTVKEILSATQR